MKRRGEHATRNARFALALAVLLVLAAATPAIGIAAVTPAAAATVEGVTGATAAIQEAEDDPSIVAEGFDPDYDLTTVLDRVERLRDLSARDRILVHEYEAEPNETGDARDQFGEIGPAGARALQLYSNATVEARQPLGFAVEQPDGVHVHLMDADDLRAYGVPQEVVLAHELVHALQFQHDLVSRSREDFRPESGEWTTDTQLTALAVVEGDAMWVTQQYIERYVDDSDYSVRQYNRTLERGAWPHSVGGTPYYYGYEFYAAAATSPEARSATLRDPPTATADLLHPGESVERAPLPDPPAVPEESGLTRYHADTVGELVIRHALRLNGQPFPRAARAADGWANDRMDYFEGEGATGPGTLWTTVWTDADEAREFADAWRAMLRANGGEQSDGVLTVPASDHAPAVHYVVEREGDLVRIVAAPSSEFAGRLVDLASADSSDSDESAESRPVTSSTGSPVTSSTGSTR